MISWYWLILAVISGVVIGVLWEDYISSICAFTVCGILFFPICIYYMFFRLTLKPVDIETFERLKNISKNDYEKLKYKHLLGNFYIWFDWKASKIWAKIFLLRLKNNMEVSKYDE